MLRIQDELEELMGELGRIHGGRDLQGRVSELLRETSWAMGGIPMTKIQMIIFLVTQIQTMLYL